MRSVSERFAIIQGQYMEILYPILILLGLAVFFAVLLSVLGKKLAVKRDERIDMVAKHLSGANCGGCGFAGCDDFATALVNGKADLSACSATSAEEKKQIAEILHIESAGCETKVVMCCGGGNKCADKYEYQGYGNCTTMEMLAGGRKECPTGCMGMGTCTDACHNFAVKVNTDGVAEINYEKCTNCGLCVKSCPKSIFKRIPADAKVYVKCVNHEKGKDVRRYCQAGCIACGICVKNCPSSAITLQDNLAVIDYSLCTGCGLCAEKCPTKVINKF